MERVAVLPRAMDKTPGPHCSPRLGALLWPRYTHAHPTLLSGGCTATRNTSLALGLWPTAPAAWGRRSLGGRFGFAVLQIRCAHGLDLIPGPAGKFVQFVGVPHVDHRSDLLGAMNGIFQRLQLRIRFTIHSAVRARSEDAAAHRLVHSHVQEPTDDIELVSVADEQLQ